MREKEKAAQGACSSQEGEAAAKRVTFCLYQWWSNLNFLYPFCSTNASQSLIILLSWFDRLEAHCAELSVIKRPLRGCADASATTGYFQRRDECSQGHSSPLTQASAPRWTGGWAGSRDELSHQLPRASVTHWFKLPTTQKEREKEPYVSASTHSLRNSPSLCRGELPPLLNFQTLDSCSPF